MDRGEHCEGARDCVIRHGAIVPRGCVMGGPAGVWLVRAAHALARETGSTERFFPDYQDRGFFIRSDEPCFARRDRPMQYYRIYVRLKSGGQATGRELRTGPPPNHGTVLDVPLITGRTVKARIGPYHMEGGKKKGAPVTSVTEVYADEI
jgi:hypothetical protein